MRKSIREIVKLEPRIGALLEEARHGEEYWDLAYVTYKARLMRLVGWSAERDELRSGEDYDVALAALCEALERRGGTNVYQV